MWLGKFLFEGLKKWIICEGLIGISIGGWGVLMVSGCVNWCGFLIVVF